MDRGQNGGQSPDTLEDVAFPVSMRGYDREAVDSYVSRVREVVAQLEASRTPEAAVKDALEKVGEQTKTVLESAGQSAEQITAAARREAEEATAHAQSEAEEIAAKAKAEASEMVNRANTEAKETVAKARKEAAEHLQRTQEEVTALREEAEARLGELSADTESIRQDRGELLDEIREFAARVEEVARAADARFPQREVVATADEETPEPEPADEADIGDTADARQDSPAS
ncbi:MAG TPA: DivIVA domain-containing protein [Gaiellaceae bacterium]